MNNGNYFSRSWALLTRQKGWIKPLLVMTVANLVPVAGPLGNKGYGLEWARLTAWGVDAAPKQKNVDVGKCIGSGWRGFVVDLGWGLLLGLAVSVVAGIAALFPGVLGDLLGALVSLAGSVAYAVFGLVIAICELRGAIYENIAAGYRLDRVFDMIKRDGSGFGRLFLMNIVCSLVLGLVGGIFSVLLVVEILPMVMQIENSYGYSEGYAVLTALANSIVLIALTCVVFGTLLAFLGNAVRLLLLNAVGLWMRQFNVPAWGRSEDPLPQAGRPNQQWDGYQSSYQAQQPQGQWQQPQQPAPQQQQWQQPAPQPQQPVAPAPQATNAPSGVEIIPLVRVVKPTQPEPELTLGQEPQPESVPSIEPTPEPSAAPEPAPTREPEVPIAPEVTATSEPPLPTEPSEPEPPQPAPREDHNVDDLFDSLRDSIRENDRVEGDDDEEDA